MAKGTTTRASRRRPLSGAGGSKASSSSSPSASAPPPPPSRPASAIPSTPTEAVLTHFDLHQRRQGFASGAMESDDASATLRRRAQLLTDLSSILLSEALSRVDLDGAGSGGDVKSPAPPAQWASASDSAARDEVIAAVLRCCDAAFAAAIVSSSNGKASSSSSAPWSESVLSTFDLAACCLCCGNSNDADADSGGVLLARPLLERAGRLSGAGLEIVRAEACRLLGMCARYLVSPPPEARKGNRKGGPSPGSVDDDDGGRSALWRDECAELAASALLPRLTDRSQAVRLAAARACGFLFAPQGGGGSHRVPEGRTEEGGDSDDYDHDGGPISDVLFALLDRMAHDPSPAVRSASVRSAPVTPVTISPLLGRVRDVKAAVRCDALSALGGGGGEADVMRDLTAEQRVDVLRWGLTER